MSLFDLPAASRNNQGLKLCVPRQLNIQGTGLEPRLPMAPPPALPTPVLTWLQILPELTFGVYCSQTWQEVCPGLAGEAVPQFTHERTLAQECHSLVKYIHKASKQDAANLLCEGHCPRC